MIIFVTKQITCWVRHLQLQPDEKQQKLGSESGN